MEFNIYFTFLNVLNSWFHEMGKNVPCSRFIVHKFSLNKESCIDFFCFNRQFEVGAPKLVYNLKLYTLLGVKNEISQKKKNSRQQKLGGEKFSTM